MLKKKELLLYWTRFNIIFYVCCNILKYILHNINLFEYLKNYFSILENKIGIKNVYIYMFIFM